MTDFTFSGSPLILSCGLSLIILIPVEEVMEQVKSLRSLRCSLLLYGNQFLYLLQGRGWRLKELEDQGRKR